jgi:3-deoxy-D-manno-octulosonic-acid transferase
VWPCLLAAARRRGVPVVLANARLSDKSLRQSLRLDALFRPAVASLSAVLAQTEDDAGRLVRAGARSDRVHVCGNLKYDLSPPPAALEAGRAWRAASERPVVLMASSREGEEAPLLAAWTALPAPRPRLLLVPRHPQRFDEVEAMVRAAGCSLSRRSAWGERAPDDAARAAEVWLGDSMGEMPRYYATADVALLGGSFAPLGGQNLIEAAACGCPLVMGPHTFNFDEAARLSEAAGSARRAPDLAQGVRLAVALCAGAEERDRMVAAAADFSAAHRGAAARTVRALSPWLGEPAALTTPRSG